MDISESCTNTIKQEIEVEVGIDLSEDEYYEGFNQYEIGEKVLDALEDEDEQNYNTMIEVRKLEKLILNLERLDDISADFFQCHECSFDSIERESYLNHLEEHIKENYLQNVAENMGSRSKHFQCPKCAFKTCIGQKLLDHLKEHEKVVMNCPYCPYETSNEILLFQHQKSVHPDSKDYTCLKCNYKTHVREEFSIHLGSHTENKYQFYSCDLCDYQTRRKWNLTQHSLTHDDRRLNKFVCPYCPTISYNKVSYMKHSKRHLNQEPFQCPYCSYKSYEKGTLSQHISVHKSEKKFQCPFCNYKSHRNWTLNNHIKKKHSNLEVQREFEHIHSDDGISVPEEEVIHIIA